jgi:hypothetical protein
MSKASFPKEQMHRIKYTKLTKEQIDRKLVPAAAGPECVSEFSDVLAGKRLKIVTDNGPVLNYTFNDKNKLSVSVDGGASVESGYGALTMEQDAFFSQYGTLTREQIVFFSHMTPKTQTGYNVFIDLESNLATVFEVWFSGYKDLREVQRQIYYGYVETAGNEAPIKRHHLTNRIEGKGFHWKQDTGIETLEFFPSIVSSSFVELTRFGGELTFCGPSDYIRINDHLFIYDRTECEFSGIMTLYVMDLLSATQAGMRLGFNEKDELEYYMFRGSGEIVGQLAIFEPFNDRGEKIPLNMPGMDQKGARPVYRPFGDHPPITESEIEEAVRKSTLIFPGGEAMAGNKMGLSHYLVGLELTVRYDNGPAWDYRFDNMKKLRWRKVGDTQWHEEVYEAFQPDRGVIFFAHMHSGMKPYECVKIVLDFSNGLTSCVHSQVGSKYMANEVSYRFIFGVIEMEGMTPPKYLRHAFTDELAGRALTWNYSDTLTSMHVYSTPHSYSWTIFMENGAMGMQWSSPSRYAKIRDGLYLFSWVEEACNGGQGTILINTKTMHDCGFGFSGGKDGLRLDTMGAFARNAGSYDVKRFFGPGY